MSRELRQIYEKLINQAQKSNLSINESQLRQQAWMMRDRMLLEGSFVSSVSSAAAGAGAGGSKRASSQESTIFYTLTDNVFTYFIYNFQSGKATPIRTISSFVGNSQLNTSRLVTTGGFYFLINDDNGDNHYFIGLDGKVAFSIITNDYGQYNLNRYYILIVDSTLYVFDESLKVRTIEFNNSVESAGFSYDDVHDGGFVASTDDGDSIYEYYIIKDGSTSPILFKTVDGNSDNVSIYQYAYSSKIVTVKNDEIIEVYNATNGDKIAEYDTSEYTNDWDLSDFSFLDSNGSFVIYGNDDQNNNKEVIFFSGVNNTFSKKSIDDTYIQYLDIFDQKNYNSTSSFNNQGGSVVVWIKGGNDSFYDTYEDIYYTEEIIILPIWSTDTTLRDTITYSAGTSSYTKGIYTDWDESNISLSINSDYINLLVDNNDTGVYYFSDEISDEIENEISDGGNDMYDGGNQIYADNVQVSYTHTQSLGWNTSDDMGQPSSNFFMNGQVLSGTYSPFAPTASSYFTNTYPGLFVCAAKGVEIDSFKIDGGLGADGNGSFTASNFQIDIYGKTYQVLTKAVSSTDDVYLSNYEPSVNHLIIVNAATYSTLDHSFSADTNSDYDEVTGLTSSGVTEVYYMLTALRGGITVTNQQAVSMATQFLTIAATSSVSTTQDLLTSLNVNYQNITNVLPQRDQTLSILRLGKDNSIEVIPTNISKYSQVNDEDVITNKVIMQTCDDYYGSFEYGWTVSNPFTMEDRFFSSFYNACDQNIGNHVIGPEFVMKDIVNDVYWAIQFSQWTNNANGGGFAYTRQLIENGGVTGSIVSFTHSNYGNEVDIIVPGVLEITRGSQGPIYNSATQSSSNGRNPTGTLWNSYYLYNNYNGHNIKHTIITNDGIESDSIISTGTEYNNDWSGNTHFVASVVDNKLYLTNTSNGNTWTELPLFDNYSIDDSSSYISDSMLSDSTFVVYSDQRFIVFNNNLISNEFTINIGDFIEISSVWMGKDYFIIRVDNVEDSEIRFYNLQGTLVSSRSFTSLTINELDFVGDRYSIVYNEGDGIKKVLIFKNGVISIIDMNTIEYIDAMVNDYSYE